VKLYLDEDVHGLLARLLRARNISVETTPEGSMLGKNDWEQLEYATQKNAVLVTHNRVDFENLFTKYVEQGKSLNGIIILIRREVYVMANRLSKFVLAHEEIKNQLWYV
jgi:predicted nuclease of predicted toxin-antitoxin system